MTQQHTPGPWTVAVSHPDGFLDRAIMADNFFVATVHDTAAHSDCWDADARLIAAAPDLLAALVNLEAYLRSTPHHNAVEAAAARAAIRSATGGTA